MKLIQCPDVYTPKWVDEKGPAIFLAGGITGCPDWQEEILSKLKSVHAVFMNPKRKDFDITDLKMSGLQIEWEHRHLNYAEVIVFWFPEETLCPITLFELGVQMDRDVPLIVGCHPNYKRKFDVVKQLSLARPGVTVVDSLEKLVEGVRVEVEELDAWF